MASLSTWHLGLWLRWQILLNLVTTTCAMMFEPAIMFIRRESGTYCQVAVISVHISIIFTKLNHVLKPVNIKANVVYCAFEPITEMAFDSDLVTPPDNECFR